VAIDRDYAQNGTIYFCFAEPMAGGGRTSLARAKLVDEGTPRLDDVTVIFRQEGGSRSRVAVRLHAPRAAGARVACAGGNFADHAAAMSERAVRRGQPAVFEGEPYQAIRNLGIWGFWKVDRESLGQNGIIPYPARCKRLGAVDKTIVEMKLAKNSHLKRNLERQAEIYKAASDAEHAVPIIWPLTSSRTSVSAISAPMNRLPRHQAAKAVDYLTKGAADKLGPRGDSNADCHWAARASGRCV
jgi:glucose/sorbosone dehydrogenase